MKRIHYFSGITISIFIGLHLFNHAYSLLGAEEHLILMDKLRVVYRNLFVESVLILAVFVQVFTGLRLFIKKRKATNGFFEKLQLWSGFYLAIFFVFHLSAVFIGRLMLGLDTNIYFGAAGLNTFPFYLFFVPYYGLAILSFFGHIAAIHSIKMKTIILGISPQLQSYFILLIGLVVTLVILYGLTNGFSGYEIPEDYNIMIGK